MTALEKISGLLFILANDDESAYKRLVTAMSDDAIEDEELLWTTIQDYVLRCQ